MLEAAGFEVVRRSGLYCVPFGPAHPPVERTARNAARLALQRATCRGVGLPHQALLGQAR
jgi:hypothetical protein